MMVTGWIFVWAGLAIGWLSVVCLVLTVCSGQVVKFNDNDGRRVV